MCILFTAPLFYLVAAIVAFILRRHRISENSRSVLLLLPILPLSLEGVVQPLTFNRDEIVVVRRAVNYPAADVERALTREPRFHTPLPWFLAIGFPRPEATSGSGLDKGDLRIIHFGGSEGRFLGEGRPGDLTLAVAESTPSHVRFDVVVDESHLPHWLGWQSSDVRWREVAAGTTEVTWTLAYERRLDPAWYFGPLERYAVTLAADYLVDNLATP